MNISSKMVHFIYIDLCSNDGLKIITHALSEATCDQWNANGHLLSSFHRLIFAIGSECKETRAGVKSESAVGQQARASHFSITTARRLCTKICLGHSLTWFNIISSFSAPTTGKTHTNAWCCSMINRCIYFAVKRNFYFWWFDCKNNPFWSPTPEMNG
jgi:hypothetical protein